MESAVHGHRLQAMYVTMFYISIGLSDFYCIVDEESVLNKFGEISITIGFIQMVNQL